VGAPVELILIRHLASRLAVPVFVVDAAGDLVFFNEPAEAVLGRRFEEIRSMPFEDWTTAFLPSEGDRALAVDELPLVVALRRGVPAHRTFDIQAADGAQRTIETTAFPLLATGGEMVGAVAMFWEIGAS
jgi:PAS domain-containing protein